MNNKMKKVAMNEILPNPIAEAQAKAQPNIDLYMKIHVAQVKGDDIGPHIEELRTIPYEGRYIWRIAQALQWGLEDFDSETAMLDFETLPTETVADWLKEFKVRVIQISILKEKIDKKFPSWLTPESHENEQSTHLN